MHVLDLFIKPEQLAEDLKVLGFEMHELKGLRPELNQSFLRMLLTGQVDEGFRFKWTDSTVLSYSGWAVLGHLTQ